MTVQKLGDSMPKIKRWKISVLVKQKNRKRFSHLRITQGTHAKHHHKRARNINNLNKKQDVMEYQSTNLSSIESDISESEDDNDTQSSTITLQDSNHTSINIFKQLPHLKKKAIIYYYLNVLNAPRKSLWYGPDGAIVKIIKELNIGRVTNYKYYSTRKLQCYIRCQNCYLL